jgi:hypothetical protein
MSNERHPYNESLQHTNQLNKKFLLANINLENLNLN